MAILHHTINDGINSNSGWLFGYHSEVSEFSFPTAELGFADFLYSKSERGEFRFGKISYQTI